MAQNIKWTVLGCSAGNISTTRNSSGYILTVDDKQYLFDCGTGICSAYKRLGFNPENTNHLFLSHMHSDHCCELALFVQMMYAAKKESQLDIWVPSEAIDIIDKYLAACYLFKEKLKFNLILNPIEGEIVIDDRNIKIAPIPNTHHQDEQSIISRYGYPNLRQCYSFRIGTSEKDILYSADLGSLDDIAEHLKKVDLLIIESMHIDLAALPGLCDKYGVGKVLLTHIGDDDLAKMTEFAANAGPDRFIVAEDGLEIAL